MDPVVVILLVLTMLVGALYFFWLSLKTPDVSEAKKSGYLEIGECPSCGGVLLISNARKLVDAPLNSGRDFDVMAVCQRGACSQVSQHPVEKGGSKLVLIEKAIRVYHDRLPRKK
jgi:hypothetical protein